MQKKIPPKTMTKPNSQNQGQLWPETDMPKEGSMFNFEIYRKKSLKLKLKKINIVRVSDMAYGPLIKFHLLC